MRQKWIAVVGLALALSLLAGASVAAAEGPSSGSEEVAPSTPGGELLPPTGPGGCSVGHACVWPHTLFGEGKGESLCTGGLHSFAPNTKLSGENQCTNSGKAVWFRQSVTNVKCLEAGESDAAFPFLVNEIWVGAEHSHC